MNFIKKFLIVFFATLTSIALLFFMELMIVAFIPGMDVPEQPMKSRAKPEDLASTDPFPFRKDVSFDVNGITIRGWLYFPDERRQKYPVIVMVTGLGGTKEMLLEKYALRFRKEGFATFTFDHRHWGQSEGKPRNLIWIPKMQEDIEGAVNFARSHKNIDPEKIALWGTSAGAAYALVVAARDPEIKAVSIQVPGILTEEAGEAMLEREGLGHALKMLVHGQRDFVRSWFGLSPHKIPMVGKPGTTAMLTAPGIFEAYEKIIPVGFNNYACARINIRADKFFPLSYTDELKSPVMIQVADKDNLIPVKGFKNIENKFGGKVELIHYPIGHFDIYFGEYFDKSVGEHIRFFKTNLITR